MNARPTFFSMNYANRLFFFDIPFDANIRFINEIHTIFQYGNIVMEVDFSHQTQS